MTGTKSAKLGVFAGGGGRPAGQHTSAQLNARALAARYSSLDV